MSEKLPEVKSDNNIPRTQSASEDQPSSRPKKEDLFTEQGQLESSHRPQEGYEQFQNPDEKLPLSTKEQEEYDVVSSDDSESMPDADQTRSLGEDLSSIESTGRKQPELNPVLGRLIREAQRPYVYEARKNRKNSFQAEQKATENIPRMADLLPEHKKREKGFDSWVSGEGRGPEVDDPELAKASHEYQHLDEETTDGFEIADTEEEKYHSNMSKAKEMGDFMEQYYNNFRRWNLPPEQRHLVKSLIEKAEEYEKKGYSALINSAYIAVEQQKYEPLNTKYEAHLDAWSQGSGKSPELNNKELINAHNEYQGLKEQYEQALKRAEQYQERYNELVSLAEATANQRQNRIDRMHDTARNTL